ncbi:hypothetical protein V502_10578, partial [Pseudogymnoascus sp. VKM F-4520 (FW-2644)]
MYTPLRHFPPRRRDSSPRRFTTAPSHRRPAIQPRIGWNSSLLPRQSLQAPLLAISLAQPPTRLDELHNIDDLLPRHDREGGTGQDPRPEGIELVCARELEGAGGPGVGEQRGGGGVGGVAGLEGAGGGGVVFELEEGGGEEGGG